MSGIIAGDHDGLTMSGIITGAHSGLTMSGIITGAHSGAVRAGSSLMGGDTRKGGLGVHGLILGRSRGIS